MSKSILDWIKSDDGKRSMSEYFEKLGIRRAIRSRHISRLHRVSNLGDFIEAVIIKYGSKSYRDRWYNRGIEPPEDLFFLLYDYAEKYGRGCSVEEFEVYGNEFCSGLYFCGGYYFMRMDGQGCVIQIIKK